VTAIVPKLRALGWSSLGFGAFQIVRLLYFLLLTWVFVRLWSARSDFNGSPETAAQFRLHQAQTWLALLNLASLLSPFVPDAYAVLGTLWLLILVMSEMAFTRVNITVLALVWLALNVVAPEGPGLPEVGLVIRTAFGFLMQATLIIVNVRVLLAANSRRAGDEGRRVFVARPQIAGA